MASAIVTLFVASTMSLLFALLVEKARRVLSGWLLYVAVSCLAVIFGSGTVLLAIALSKAVS